MSTAARVRHAAAIAAVALFAAACGGGDERSQASSARENERGRTGGAGATTRNVPAAGRTGGGPSPSDGCPSDGVWRPCSVLKRLEQAGLVPKQAEEDGGRVREAKLSVPGTAYQLGRARLALFYYPDRAARQRDQARLDSTRFVRWDQDLSLRGERTLIVSENLLAILESRSGAQRERIANALTAGPPQAR